MRISQSRICRPAISINIRSREITATCIFYLIRSRHMNVWRSSNVNYVYYACRVSQTAVTSHLTVYIRGMWALACRTKRRPSRNLFMLRFLWRHVNGGGMWDMPCDTCTLSTLHLSGCCDSAVRTHKPPLNGIAPFTAAWLAVYYLHPMHTNSSNWRIILGLAYHSGVFLWRPQHEFMCFFCAKIYYDVYQTRFTAHHTSLQDV